MFEIEANTEKGLRDIKIALVISLLDSLVIGGFSLGFFSRNPYSYGSVSGLVAAICGLSIFILAFLVIYFYFFVRGGMSIVSDASAFGRKHQLASTLGFVLIFVALAADFGQTGAKYSGMGITAQLSLQLASVLMFALAYMLLVFFISGKNAKFVMLLAVILSLAAMAYAVSSYGTIGEIARRGQYNDNDLMTLQVVFGVTMGIQVFSRILFILAYLWVSSDVYNLRQGAGKVGPGKNDTGKGGWPLPEETEEIPSYYYAKDSGTSPSAQYTRHCSGCGALMKAGDEKCTVCGTVRI